MKQFKGTGRLVRLALRRDRWRLPLWLLGIGGSLLAIASSMSSAMSDPQAKVLYFKTATVSAVARAFGGIITGSSLAEIITNKSFTTVIIFGALMSILLVVRHTRQNEETGCAELTGAAVVGRLAPLAAALGVLLGANMLLAIWATLGLAALKLPLNGALVYGLSFAAMGLFFGSVAAVTAQLSQSARGANGLAGICLAGSFLVRAIGDMQGKIPPGSMIVQSSWLSWLSPIGWVQRVQPFAATNNWWMLGAVFLASALCMVGALTLAARRDVGAGVLSVRPGRAQARPALLRPLGLAWRLQRNAALAWVASMGVLSVSLGGVAQQVNDILGPDQGTAKLIQRLGSSQNFLNAYLTFAINAMGLAVGGYVVQCLLRLHSEEADGHAEFLLAGGLNRYRWMLSYVAVALLSATVLLLGAGMVTGLTHGFITGDVTRQTVLLTKAALVQLPAVLLLGSVVAALFAVRPRWSVAVAWTSLLLCIGMAQFAVLLKLPQIVIDLSPFSHTPPVPAGPVIWKPLLILTATALVLGTSALFAFRRRDLAL